MSAQPPNKKKSAQTAAAKKTTFGSSTKFATVPAVPGFPEGVAVHGDSVFVAGPARLGSAGTPASALQVYDRKTGTHEQTIVFQGENLALDHTTSNLAVDSSGQVYALSRQLGLVRFTKKGKTYQQSAYGAPLPDLRPVAGPDFTPVPNDVVFDDAGNAYVTDSLQATIFRYAPGGGAAQIWFQSPLFIGNSILPLGLNGIRLDPQRKNVYFAVSTSPNNVAIGTIYRLPLVNKPTASQLEVFHQYVAGETPDQLAFANDGRLFISLAFSHQISILSTTGAELGRISSQPDDELAFDNPAGIAFDSRTKSLFVVNHALFTGDPTHFAVLSVFVDNPGDPLVKGQ
jgi:sugar lactone lactonase YvrE